MGAYITGRRDMRPQICNAQLLLCVLACGIVVASGDQTLAALSKVYQEAAADHAAFYRTYHAALLAQKGFDHEMMVQTAQQGPEMPHKTRMDGGANRWWQRKDWRGHNAAKPTKAPKKHTPTKWKHFNYLRINPVHKVPAPPQHSPTNVVGVRGWRDSHTFGDSSFKPGAHSSLHRHLEKTEEGQDSGQEGAIMGHPLLHSAGLTKRSIARDERTLEHEKKHAKKSMALIQELHEVGGLHEGFVNQLAQRVKPDPKPSSHDDTDTNQELVQKIDEQILQEAEKTEKAKKTTDVAAKSAAAVEEMSAEEEEEEDPLSQIP